MLLSIVGADGQTPYRYTDQGRLRHINDGANAPCVQERSTPIFHFFTKTLPFHFLPTGLGATENVGFNAKVKRNLGIDFVTKQHKSLQKLQPVYSLV